MKKLIFTTLLFVLACSPMKAQYGTSAGSLQYARDYKNSSSNSTERRLYKNTLAMPSPETFIVEDFMNYHVHNIDIPKNEDVALSIDYDNNLLKKDNEFILQVGIATQPVNIRSEKRNNVNISLVVDVSGSMYGQKMERTREALHHFVESLNTGDYLSIVLFSDAAKVVLPAARISENRSGIYSVIKKIEADGYTNLNAGMMLGYQEVVKNHSANVNSRVILLTDGMTNRGITDLKKIVANSQSYNTKGIEISTIGVGQSLDFNLLRELADKGRGSNYFIGDDGEDLCKIFDDELDAMMYSIGKQPNVTVKLPEGWEVTQFYGYKPKYVQANAVSVDIANLGASSTRILMMKVKKNNSECGGTITASIRYKDKGKAIRQEKTEKYNQEFETTNEEVGKNYDIAFMAQTLRDAATACNKNNQSKAERILNNTVAWMQDSSYTGDSDFQRVYDILLQYAPQKIAQHSTKQRYIME